MKPNLPMCGSSGLPGAHSVTHGRPALAACIRPIASWHSRAVWMARFFTEWLQTFTT